ncbi:hypothetical protein [Sporosarcina psychrophila]|uniref:hypothetical protein n=1 Tax=Sporosarcina psychrophila TaxID=1476 RepID=UPI0030D45450
MARVYARCVSIMIGWQGYMLVRTPFMIGCKVMLVRKSFMIGCKVICSFVWGFMIGSQGYMLGRASIMIGWRKYMLGFVFTFDLTRHRFAILKLRLRTSLRLFCFFFAQRLVQ